MQDLPSVKILIADCCKDADWPHKGLKKKGISPCMPSWRNRKTDTPPWPPAAMPAGEFAGVASRSLGQAETGRVQGEDFLRPNCPQSRSDRVNPTWFRSE